MIQKTTKTMHNIFDIFTLLSFLTLTSSLLYVANGENYVNEACSVTIYPDLCVKSLAFYSNKAKKNPHIWARVGVSVTISEVKFVSRYLHTMRRHSHHIKGRKNWEALSDCVECIEDALYNLYKSLGVLRRLSAGEFDVQMSDVLTWLSAALTDEDACINGFEFEDHHRKEQQITRICDEVQNVSHITSNALALVNKLASTGLQNLGGDT